MKTVISISEVVETASDWRGEWEVCASADATYDETNSVLIVHLKSFSRPVETRSEPEIPLPDWMPAGETVRERVSLEEAVEVAKDIFHRWVTRIRRCILSTTNP
jgi:hypothetical protein